MTTSVKLAEMADGRSFYFEEDVRSSGALQNVGLSDFTAKLDFDDALDSIKHAAGRVLGALASLAEAPDAIEITFGIKLSTAVGAIIAKAGGEANFEVKLSWSDKRH